MYSYFLIPLYFFLIDAGSPPDIRDNTLTLISLLPHNTLTIPSPFPRIRDVISLFLFPHPLLPILTSHNLLSHNLLSLRDYEIRDYEIRDKR
jgi:hypothetical protein